MARSWTLALLAALFGAAVATAQPALDHGGAPAFDPAAFETNAPGTTPMVLAPDPAAPGGFESGMEFAGPGYGAPADRPTADVGVPSQGGPQYGGAPVGGEFDVVTAGPDQYSVRFPQQGQGFAYPPPDGRYFQPFDMPAHPSGPSAACRNGNCFGHNYMSGAHLRDGNPTPLAERTRTDAQAVYQFQQDSARAHGLQENRDAVPSAWTKRDGVVDEHRRWDRYVQELQQHPNQMGQMGFYFPGEGKKVNGHVDPTRGVPREVELVNADGKVVQRGTWQGLWHNQWFPLDVNTGAARPHDGYGIVRLNPGSAGQNSPGYVFTYNPEDRLQARAAEQFQGGRPLIHPDDVYPMPEFSADPNTRAHFRNTPTVPLRDAYYPPQLPAVGAPGSQGGRGIGLNDVSD